MNQNHFSEYTSSYYSYSNDYSLQGSINRLNINSNSIQAENKFTSTKSRFLNSNPYTHGLFKGTKARVVNTIDKSNNSRNSNTRKYKKGRSMRFNRSLKKHKKNKFSTNRNNKRKDNDKRYLKKPSDQLKSQINNISNNLVKQIREEMLQHDSNNNLNTIINDWISVYSTDQNYDLIKKAVISKLTELTGKTIVLVKQPSSSNMTKQPSSNNMTKENSNRKNVADKTKVVRPIDLMTDEKYSIKPSKNNGNKPSINNENKPSTNNGTEITNNTNLLRSGNVFVAGQKNVSGQMKFVSITDNTATYDLVTISARLELQSEWPIELTLESPVYPKNKVLQFSCDINNEMIAIGQLMNSETIQIDLFMIADKEIEESQLKYPIVISTEFTQPFE
jgi:hypothetical protein